VCLLPQRSVSPASVECVQISWVEVWEAEVPLSLLYTLPLFPASQMGNHPVVSGARVVKEGDAAPRGHQRRSAPEWATRSAAKGASPTRGTPSSQSDWQQPVGAQRPGSRVPPITTELVLASSADLLVLNKFPHILDYLTRKHDVRALSIPPALPSPPSFSLLHLLFPRLLSQPLREGVVCLAVCWESTT
jgi:hypothetical protein